MGLQTPLGLDRFPAATVLQRMSVLPARRAYPIRLRLRGEGGALMPKDRDRGADMPATLERSPRKARETWQKTHDSAVETYGEGERAHRTAFSSLKHSFEKVGDHWEPKDHKGPSDAQAAKSGAEAREQPAETFGGLDVAGRSKDALEGRARELGIKVKPSMRKTDIARAIARKQR